MKQIVIAGFLSLAIIGGEAMAGCTTGRVADINAVVNNKLVCGQQTGGSDQYQEEHNAPSLARTRGTLYERGKGNAIEPRKMVGNWRIENNGQPNSTICYDYAGGSSFCFALYDNSGGNYSFCNGTTEVATGTFIAIPGPGVNACGFY